jgi:hypothetical protein
MPATRAAVSVDPGRSGIRRAPALLVAAILAATALLGATGPDASAAAPTLSFEPQLGAPAEDMDVFGAASAEAPAAPGEATGAIWATGLLGPVPASVDGRQLDETQVLLRHPLGNGHAWEIVPVAEAAGNALAFTGLPSVTPTGGLVLFNSEVVNKATVQTIVTRDPGGAFVKAPPPPSPPKQKGEELIESEGLEAGETLFSSGSQQGASLFTAIDEGQHTGALIVPAGLSKSNPGVLHYDGSKWTREPICLAYSHGACIPPEAGEGLSVVAIAASSAQNAWLLAQAGNTKPLELFRRESAGSGTLLWVLSTPPSWNVPGEDSLSMLHSGQLLTVTSQGVWVDALLNNPNIEEGSVENSEIDVSLLVEAGSPEKLPEASSTPAPKLLGQWCYPQSGCPGASSLGAPLPPEYRSFAWPGAGEGTRILAGLEDGALLRFQGSGNFEYVVGGGGNASIEAAFASLEEGWLSDVSSRKGLNSAQLERVSASASTPPASSLLRAWPLPFRRPLTAIATEPGSAPGDSNAQALAVGELGQIARYLPGQGSLPGHWTEEFLYNANGEVTLPRLRGVAWPEPNRAYAVGDNGEMWVWRAETGLWEPDPAKPLNFHANLTAIAFSPSEPGAGYAVGKQGALLAYDKTWTQQKLPPGLEAASFTAVAFAGRQALVTYRMVVEGKEVGGLIVHEPGGEWQIDPSAQKLLAELPKATASVLSKVAGLPDGGAVAAGPEIVIERDTATSPWRFSRYPLPEAQNIAALAAIRASPTEVRALVSADLDELSNPNSLTDYILKIDQLPEPGFDEPLGLVGPDPLPVSGYLLRETPEGWEDLEDQAYPRPRPSGSEDVDLPNWPDAVLALDLNPSGTEGWAVGGQTGGIVEESGSGAPLVSQSAAALRLGSGPAPPESASAPIATPAGQVTFALGGNAQCAAPCADFANEGMGPDAWLSGAAARAAQIPGLRAFLYSGARVAEGAGRSLGFEAFDRELEAYRHDLEAAGSLPVYAAASPSDVDGEGSLSAFEGVLGSDVPAGSVPPGTPAPPAGSAAYAFESPGAGGTVRVIVLDYSASALPPGELEWLEAQLDQAAQVHIPTIVMGNANLSDPTASNHAQDASAVDAALLAGGASAYLFDSPGENRSEQIGSGGNAIPALGSGTLGYVLPPAVPTEFLGASGFLLVSVNVAERNGTTNRAPVTATLVPSISQLALDATDGTLLRRSQVALFQGLARRPAGGLELEGAGGAAETAPDPYVPIPERCIGGRCGQFIAPSYTFSSSKPDFGQFVEQEPNNPNLSVLQGPNGKPIPDEPRNSKGELNPDGRFSENAKGEPINEKGEVVSRAQSGVFCAYNAGTTTVSITAGGLTYSQEVTVQAGSVEQPCGTVPLVNPPAAAVSAAPPATALPPSTPPAASPAPLAVAPPPPPPPVVPTPPVLPLVQHPTPPAPPLLIKPLPTVTLVATVLPPPPPLARPIPPSGAATVSVFQPAVAEKREDEEAVESARNSMAVYEPGSPRLPPAAPLALIVLAAGVGASVRRAGRSRDAGRMRRRRPAPAFVQARSSHYRRPR